MKTKIEKKEVSPVSVKLVLDALGDRAARLEGQPLCLAGGGLEKVVQGACKECAGFPDPLAAAVNRTLQLCGSKTRKKKADAKAGEAQRDSVARSGDESKEE